MIRKKQYTIAHDNPILARVRQFYDAKKSDPYIIFVENKNLTNTEVTIFDAQNSVGKSGFGLPSGVSVNTSFNYTTGSQLTTTFNTASGTFNAGTTASFAGKTASYDLAGLTIAQASALFQTNSNFSISAILTRDGVSARITYEFATDDDSLTNLTIGAQTFALTRSDSGFAQYAGARSPYVEFLQQVMVRPMAMEGNFFDSTNPSVIQTNDLIVSQQDVTGESIQTFLSANLDPYMRSSQRTLPNFNMIDGQTSLTLTLPAVSQTILYLFATMEMDNAEMLEHSVDPENMTEEKINGDEKPFDDYILPTKQYSF